MGAVVQVMDWTQRVLAIGESFSGVECAGLRNLLQRQSGNFFRAFHTSNLEVRHLPIFSFVFLFCNISSCLSPLQAFDISPLLLPSTGAKQHAGQGVVEAAACGHAQPGGHAAEEARLGGRCGQLCRL